MQRLAWKCGTWRLPPDQSNPKILTVAVGLSPRILYVRPPSRTPFSNSIDYAKFRSRSHDAVIRVYDDAGNVIATHEHAGEFKEPATQSVVVSRTQGSKLSPQELSARIRSGLARAKAQGRRGGSAAALFGRAPRPAMRVVHKTNTIFKRQGKKY